MAALRHILMLLLLLFTQLQEIGTGSESRCDCVISLIYNGTLSEVSWTFSKQLCNAENEGYIIKTPRSQNSSEPEDILFCTCKSGRPYCRVEPGFNYSIENNIITLTLNSSDEGTFSFEKLPLNEKCQCTFELSAQVPYVPEEDATTSTTRNPHPATTLTTSSTTPTQGARSENTAAIVLGILNVVLIAVFIISHMYVHKKHKHQLQKRDKRILKLVDERQDKNKQIWDLKIELQESRRIRNLELNTNKPQDQTSFKILNEEQPQATVHQNTNDTNEKSDEERAERERNVVISSGKRSPGVGAVSSAASPKVSSVDSHTVSSTASPASGPVSPASGPVSPASGPVSPASGPVSTASGPVSTASMAASSPVMPSTYFSQQTAYSLLPNTTYGLSVHDELTVQNDPQEKQAHGPQFDSHSGVELEASMPEPICPKNGLTEQDADVSQVDDASGETHPLLLSLNTKPREQVDDSQGVKN